MFIAIFIKLLVGVVAMIFVVRIIGRKSLSKITPFDLVYTLVLGGILEGPLYDEKIHIGHILFGMGVWGLLIYLIEKIVKKNDFINHLIKGSAAILIKDGMINGKALEKNKIEMEQLRTLIRNNGYFALEQVKDLVLEAGGTSNLLPINDEDKYFTYLVIDEGVLEPGVLQLIKKDDFWLKNEVERLGYSNIQEIIYGEWSKEKGLYLVGFKNVSEDNYKLDG